MLWTDLIYRYSEIVAAPFRNPDILWFAIPLLAVLIITELNFATHKQKHSIKQALPISIVIFFVGLDLLRFTFMKSPSISTFLSRNFAISCFVVLLSMFVFTLDYFGKFPNKTFLKISAYLPVNVAAYICMVLVYNAVELDWITVFAAVVFTIVIWVLIFLVLLVGPHHLNYEQEERHKKKEEK